MDLVTAIETRRSVKQFDPDRQLSDDELRQLVRLGALAPTSFNMQNWHFVAVREDDRKADLAAAAYNQVQVANASVVIVLCGNLKAHTDTTRYLRNAPEVLRSMFDGMIRGFYAKNDALARDEACRSVGFAGQNMMLAARAMGLDSCPMIGYEPDRVTELLGLPAHCPPLLMLAIGKAEEPARPRLGLLDYDEILSCEIFGNHSLEGEIAHE
ncbi:MAG: nitroreductase family protein [Planctomycetota bacterium]|nr:nitroreductase family protein [Planctomycetota bacterium]